MSDLNAIRLYLKTFHLEKLACVPFLIAEIELSNDFLFSQIIEHYYCEINFNEMYDFVYCLILTDLIIISTKTR